MITPICAARRTAALLVTSLLWAAGGAAAQAPPVLSEAQIKAGFVLNFARYVEWPAAAFATRESPVVACVQGRESVAAALAALESRPVQGRSLKLRRVGTPEEVAGCHVLFIGETEARRTQPWLRAPAGQPVLTVGDGEHFIDIGGAIGLVQADERLQFEVNRRSLEQHQLKASAHLLRLARNLP